jgi:tRNA-specific 2-thiouridylase
VDKDAGRNALIVDQGDTPLLLCDALVAARPAWIGREPVQLDAGLRCKAKIRYRQRDQDCTVRRALDDRLMVAFDEPQRAAAPGQFIVFYQDDRCLGGAVIEAVERRGAAARSTPEPAFS